MTERDVFSLPRSAVARAFDRASPRYEAAARLQATVREELLSRAEELMRGAAPAVVLDLGAGTGAATAALRRRHAGARVIALDIAPGMLREAARHRRPWRRFDRVAADAVALPFADHCLDLVFSSLMLQWIDDPAQAFRELARAMRPGALLAFSTFGPQTLRELREAFEEADPGGVHVNRFIDVHDVGMALQSSGFVEPVLDVDRHRLHYPDAMALLRELKSIGANNVAAGRARTLTGRGRIAAMTRAYERLREPAGLPATWEVIYGIAWAGEPREARFDTPVAAEARFSVQTLLSKLKGRR